MVEQLRIVIGSDDAGFSYKEIIKEDFLHSPHVASVVDVLEFVAPVAVAELPMSTGAPLVLGASSSVVMSCTVVMPVEALEV